MDSSNKNIPSSTVPGSATIVNRVDVTPGGRTKLPYEYKYGMRGSVSYCRWSRCLLSGRKWVKLLMRIQNSPVEPYTPVVMPHLVNAASTKAEISAYEEDKENVEER